MNLTEIIGETSEYEKKQALEIRRPKSWCKTVSAFANSLGGKLIFGIANDGAAVGLASPEKDAELISETIKMHLNPLLDFRLSFAQIEEKTIIVLAIGAGNQTPYYYQGEGQLVAFVRVGNESVQAAPSRLRELVLKGSGQTYDSLKSPSNLRIWLLRSSVPSVFSARGRLSAAPITSLSALSIPMAV